ncbi:MAG: NAD(P)H-dependent oxidoreductase [Alphaproteobacteria bacterium]|nr:NAD(P)H-dependent oxidoreductase [Alphaproteobacteria bacterium]
MATSLLRIDCSLKAAGTLSRRMGDQALRALSGYAPDARVTQRVLAVDPVAPVDAGFTASMITHQAAEMEKTDTRLLTTPMRNFTVPEALKGWDR